MTLLHKSALISFMISIIPIQITVYILDEFKT